MIEAVATDGIAGVDCEGALARSPNGRIIRTMGTTSQPRRKASQQVWSPLEAMDQQELQGLHLQKLKTQMAYVSARSDFYRDKFREAGVDATKTETLADLSRLPFTEKDEIRASLAAHPPLGRHLCASMDDIIQRQASSGTTGKPCYFAYTRADLEMVCETTTRCFFAAGFRPGDPVLHAFAMARGFVGGLPMAQAMSYMGLSVLPIGAESGIERLLKVIADQRPVGIIGAPSFIGYLGEQAEIVLGQPAHELGIGNILVGSEPGGGQPETRARLEKLWGAQVREMYGMSDLANSFYAEGPIPDGMHFLGQGHIHMELIDPVSGEVLPEEKGVEGELVYTALDRQAMPLVRFRSRDHVRVLGNDRLNGRTGPRIRVMGRTDDMLICRGINVYPGALLDIVNGLKPMTTGLFRIALDFAGHSTDRPLRLRVERGSATENDDVLKTRLVNSIKELVGIKVAIEIVDAGTFASPGSTKPVLIERVVAPA